MRRVKKSPVKRECGYTSLARAICEQAVYDYFANIITEREFHRFCASQLFVNLYGFDGENFFKRVKKEKENFT